MIIALFIDNAIYLVIYNTIGPVVDNNNHLQKLINYRSGLIIDLFVIMCHNNSRDLNGREMRRSFTCLISLKLEILVGHLPSKTNRTYKIELICFRPLFRVVSTNMRQDPCLQLP